MIDLRLIILLALNTLSQSELISRQFDLLLILPLFSLYLSYLLSIVSETTRSPFDLVEAESELVGGWATEYPGIYFSLFFMAEYCNVIALSSLASIYFFSQLSIVFSLLPILIHISSLVNVRSTFPRYRQDQLMFILWFMYKNGKSYKQTDPQIYLFMILSLLFPIFIRSFPQGLFILFLPLSTIDLHLPQVRLTVRYQVDFIS